MITGHVNSKLEAVISLKVYGVQDEAREIEAVIDTGYSNHLTLPTELIATLGLSTIGTEQLTLADGSEITSAICPVMIVWDDQSRTIGADTFESEPLIGMALLEGYDLKARVKAGGRVTIKRFSDRAATTAKPRGGKH